MKQDCPNEIQVSAYADGELGAEETAWIESHLADCESCRQAVTAYRELDQLIHDLPEPAVTASFDRAFRDRLERATKSPMWYQHLKSLFTGWRPVWAAAATMCLVVGIFFYRGPENEVFDPEDIVIVENIEFFQNLDFLQKLELLEKWDTIPMGNDRS